MSYARDMYNESQEPPSKSERLADYTERVIRIISERLRQPLAEVATRLQRTRGLSLREMVVEGETVTDIAEEFIFHWKWGGK